jgi:tetratricopeptide (TPR) repeat protein
MPLRHGVEGMWNDQRFFFNQTLDYARSEPLGFAGGLARKTIQFAGSREVPRNVDLYIFREWSSILGLLTWKIGPWGFPFGLLLPFALAGFVLCRRSIPKPLLLFAVLYPFSIILVFVSARYRVAVVPAFAILAAAGGWTILDTARSWTSLRKTIFVACGIGVVFISTLPDPFGQEERNYKAELYYGIGCTQQINGKNREAVKSFVKAIQMMPDFADAYNNLGGSLAALNRPNDALKHYQKAIQIKPDYAQAHYNMGTSLVQIRRMTEAMKSFEEAVRIMPDHGEARFNLGLALHMTGDDAKSAEHLKAAVDLLPEAAEAHYFLGVVLANQREFPRAITAFNEALKLNPDWPEALNGLSRILATSEDTGLRDPATSVKLAERACRLTGFSNPTFLETLALAYGAGGRKDEAISMAIKAAELARSSGQDALAENIESRFRLKRVEAP